MNKQEIIDYLKQNLEIRLDFTAYDYGPVNRLEVRLLLEDQVISEYSTTVEPDSNEYNYD
jgi:hypothetical protein